MADLFDIAVARKLSGGSGGGSSDFSTAQVTLSANAEDTYIQISSVVLDIVSRIFVPPYPISDPLYYPLGYDTDASLGETLTVVLYQGAGYATFYAYHEETVSVSGSATIEQYIVEDIPMYFIIITGDCTITIS